VQSNATSLVPTATIERSQVGRRRLAITADGWAIANDRLSGAPDPGDDRAMIGRWFYTPSIISSFLIFRCPYRNLIHNALRNPLPHMEYWYIFYFRPNLKSSCPTKHQIRIKI